MTAISDLIQLIYVSHPFGYDAQTLNGILLDARRCNARDGVTGALVCRHDIFLQLLEGPVEAVDATYQRISRDDRHANAQLLVRRQVVTRLFGEWAMLHDPAKTWIWSPEQVAEGQVAQASEAEIMELFEDLAYKVAADSARPG